MRVLLCVAQGLDHRWEAYCLDFDLAVQGQSFDDVRARLEAAIGDYVETAMAEAEPARERLLNRRAPFLVRLAWMARVASAMLFGKRADDDDPRAPAGAVGGTAEVRLAE